MNWYYVKRGERLGPVAESDLRALLQRNEINANTRIWRKGMADWQRAGEAAPEWFAARAGVATATLSPPGESKARRANGSGRSPVVETPGSTGPSTPSSGAPKPEAAGMGAPTPVNQFMCSSCGNLVEQHELAQGEGGRVCASCAAANQQPAQNRQRHAAGKVASASELWRRMVEDHFKETLLVGVTFFCVLGLIAAWRTGQSIDFPLRLAASTSFMLVALVCGAFDTRYGKAILLGLFCCWIGNLAMGVLSFGTMQVGLGAFIAGQCLFVAAFWMRGVNQSYYPKGVGAFLIGASLLMGYVVLFGVDGAFRGFGLALALIAAAVGTVAYGARFSGAVGTLAFLGAITLVVADIGILHMRFVKPHMLAGIVTIFAYYGALMMLAFSTAYEHESAHRKS